MKSYRKMAPVKIFGKKINDVTFSEFVTFNIEDHEIHVQVADK